MPVTSGHKQLTAKAVTIDHKLVTTESAGDGLEFGRRVFEARRRLLWTRADLCQRTRKLVPKGIHENTVYNIEVRGTGGNLVTRRVITETITTALGYPYPWEDQAVPFSRSSLAQLIKESEVINKIDHDIASDAALRITPPESFLDPIIERMDRCGVKSASEIEQLLKQRQQLVTNFGICCYRTPALRLPFVPRGVGVAILQVIRVLEKDGVAGLEKFLSEYSLDKKADSKKRARILNQAYALAQRM